jgi:hypothetical protein
VHEPEPYATFRAPSVLSFPWKVFKVNSVILNADRQVEAVTDQYGNFVNPPPPKGSNTLAQASPLGVGRPP